MWNLSLISDIFASPFKLISAENYSHPTMGLKVKFKTDDIHDSTTKEEVYILSKQYLDNIIAQYKNYSVDGRQTRESTYRLYVAIEEDYELNKKHVYSMAYNNIADKISIENKFYDNYEIEGDFYVGIDVSTFTWDPYDSEEDDSEEEGGIFLPAKKAISEAECIVCFENPPNIIYLDCFHRCVCASCDCRGEFRKCPLCRTRIKKQKIRID